MSYQSKDTGIHGRQLITKEIPVSVNLVTGVCDLPSNVLVDKSILYATTVTLDVNEPVLKCFKVTVRNRITGAVIPTVSRPSISGDTISILLDGTGLTDVAIKFFYATSEDPVPASAAAAGPEAVDLLTSANYAILAKSAITTTAGSLVTGDMGISPAAAASITGFGLVLDGGGTFSTSALVIGQVYAADYAAPTPATLTQAISDMEAAYTDAAGRANPDTFNLGGGNIGGLTIAPGIHKWSTNVTIPLDVTLDGSASDVWIFQIAGTLDLATSKKIVLTGGALAENVFFAVAGAVTLFPSSEFNGILLAQTNIAIQTSAVFNGRALAQTAVTLDDVTLTEQP